MATLRLITETEFRQSRYNQIADQIEGRLSDLIAQAEDYIEAKLQRKLKTQTHIDLLTVKKETLFVKQYPITSITQVRTRPHYLDNWTIQSLSDFRISPYSTYIQDLAGNCAEKEAEVTYVAGFASIPWDIKNAVILQSVIFSYQDLEVYGAGDAKKPGILYLQEQVDDILCNYKRNLIL